MSYDDWKTSEPDDRETCGEHGRIKPCWECKREALEVAAEEKADALREDRLMESRRR
jgi:hypothetical protein